MTVPVTPPAGPDSFPAGMVDEWRRFLSVEHADPEDVFKTGTLFPLQRQAEWRRMMEIAQTRNPSTVMEIGADKGGSLWLWCRCLPNVKSVIGCEIRGTPYAQTFGKVFPNLDLLLLGASSYDRGTIATVRGWLGRSDIDVLFIDGDKGGMLQDFDAYLPMMSPSGVVFLHDIRDDGPRDAWETIKARGYLTEHILDLSDSILAMERESQGTPAANPHENWLRHWKGRSCSVGVVYLGEPRISSHLSGEITSGRNRLGRRSIP